MIAWPHRMQVHVPLPYSASSVPFTDGLTDCFKDLIFLAGVKIPSANYKRNLSLFFSSVYQKWSLKLFVVITDALLWSEIVEKT